MTLESDRELAEVLEKANWDDLTRRLLVYTAYRLSRYGAAKRRLSKAASDYVHEAVLLTLTGQRHFPLERGVSLFGFLCGVVDSLISHDSERARRAGLVSLREAEEEDSDELDDSMLPAYEIEREILAHDEAERFIESLDAELKAYAELRLHGEYSTAEEYARALNTTVAQIRNLDRRLRRKRFALLR